MLADALEHIDQVRIGVDVVQAAGGDEGLCAMPTYLAPTSVQQKSQLRRPIGVTRRARSRWWLVSIGTSGSERYTSRAAGPALTDIGHGGGER